MCAAVANHRDVSVSLQDCFEQDESKRISLTESLIEAIRAGNRDSTEALLTDPQLYVNQKTSSQQTALHFASLVGTPRSLEVVQRMVSLGADARCGDGSGWTPPCYAAYT